MRIPSKPGNVRWPWAYHASLPVDRDWAALLLSCARHVDPVKGRRVHAHFLEANGRAFKWPVFGAKEIQ